MTKINRDINIEINNLEVETIIGVFEEEKHNPQKLIIDAKIKFDASKSMHSDDLVDTIDYLTLTKSIKKKVESSRFDLLESLLEFVLRIIMKNNLVQESEVTIKKPEALKKFGAMVSVSSCAKK